MVVNIAVNISISDSEQIGSFFFFQAEDGIRDFDCDWSSDVCSSDLPLLIYMRSRMGSTFPHVALVDERPTGYHGKEHIVVIRAMSTDSTYINFSIDVVNEAMTEGVRSVQIMTAPWPDLTLRIDRVRSEERRVGKECRSRWS